MKLESLDFENGRMMAYRNAKHYQNMSPSVQWTEIPEGTVEFALVCVEINPMMHIKVHWIVYNIPREITGIPAGLRCNETVDSLGFCSQGMNDWGRLGYDGPEWPLELTNQFIFILYALREKLNLPPGLPKVYLDQAIEGKVIEQSELFGLFYEGPVGAGEYR